MRERLDRLHREHKVKSSEESKSNNKNSNTFLFKDSSIEEIDVVDTKHAPISKIEIIDRTPHTQKSNEVLNKHLNIKEFELSNRDQLKSDQK